MNEWMNEWTNKLYNEWIPIYINRFIVSFILIFSPLCILFVRPFINVIRKKSLLCIYCFLPVLFEFARRETISWLLLLGPLCWCWCWCRQAKTFTESYPAIATETNLKTCIWLGPARRKRLSKGVRRILGLRWETYKFRLQAQLPHMFAQMLPRLFNFV